MPTAHAETAYERLDRLILDIDVALEYSASHELAVNRARQFITEYRDEVSPTMAKLRQLEAQRCDHPRYTDGYCVQPGCANHNPDAVRTTDDWPFGADLTAVTA